MMAESVDGKCELSSEIQKLEIGSKNGEHVQNGLDLNTSKWGLPVAEVYKLALSFYKEKEGKAVQLSYEDKLQLVAFSQQVSHGPLSIATNKLPPPGALDVVGRDRRVAWQRLGNLSADDARTGFVELLARRCPVLNAHIEAHRREKEEQERLAKEEAKLKLIEEEKQREKDAEQQRIQEQLEKEEAVRRQIQQALNEQTYDQFRTYAEQQFPGEPERQGALIRQLQEQHYFQYMQQLQASPPPPPEAEPSSEPTPPEREDPEPEDDEVSPASMWTRADIQEFKQAVAQAEGDGVVRVGHGETITVRVPTHKEGNRLFWEFATDHYDIGFGVYFEWGVPVNDQVSVHVSESEDDDEDLEDEDALEVLRADIEAAGGALVSRPPVTEIVPVFRRDCQNEVYAGSHTYPGQGVYLLKFDNSYSLWRSKTLYYRVYYTQ